MFIILVENAFKHGVENLREKASVFVSIKSNKGGIDFKVENNFDPQQVSKDSGIGIRNLTRRLALAYPKKHTLTFENTNLYFTAHLQLRK